jgi:threonine dehydrogenase-like Zn-dependent dehydrogenase
MNKALLLTAPGDLRITDLPLPPPSGDQLLIRVRHMALCGSDIKLYQGTYKAPHKYPIVIGHEWIGQVEEAGPQASATWKKGDLVTGECSIFCGCCPACQRNRNYCQSIEKMGITLDGGGAQHIVVSERHLHRCPALGDVSPLALTEPLAVAVQGIQKRVGADTLRQVRHALIFGCGGIGIMSVFALLDAGVPNITVVDVAEEKIALVRSFGLPGVTTRLGGPSSDQPFDLIVEAAGTGPTLARAMELAAPCATIVCLGHQGSVNADFGLVLRKSLSIVASLGSCGGFERAIDIISERHDLIKRMITRRLAMDDVPAYLAREQSSAQDVKVLIDLT